MKRRVALATWWAWSAPAATGMAVPPPPPAAVAAESTIDAASPPLVVATAPVGAEDGRSRVAAPAAAPARGLLRVRVRRAGDGAPVAAVKLRVRGGLTDDPGRRSAGEAVSEALARSSHARDQFGKTDAAGAAEFEVPAGFVEVAGWFEISASAEVRSGEVAELVMEAPVRFTAAVRVVDLAGKPLRHWIVDWTGGGWRRRAYTNADGRAHCVELPVAQGRITVSRDQDTSPLAQRDVASDAAVTVAVDPTAGGRAELRGIVAPPAGMELAALQAWLVRRGDEPGGSDVRTLAIDPATGAFAATQLAAGIYMLTVGSRATGPTPLLLRDAIAVPVEGTVDLGRLVIGAGRLAVQAKLADGSPVADAVMLVRMFAGAPFVLLPDSLPDHQPSSLRLPVGEYALLVWGEAIAPVVASGRVQIDPSTTVSVVTERAATVVLQLPADGAEVDGCRLTVRSNGGAPVHVALQLAAPLARGFAAGRHELEFDSAGGKRFAAAFTVGPGLERQLVTLQPRQ